MRSSRNVGTQWVFIGEKKGDEDSFSSVACCTGCAQFLFHYQRDWEAEKSIEWLRPDLYLYTDKRERGAKRAHVTSLYLFVCYVRVTEFLRLSSISPLHRISASAMIGKRAYVTLVSFWLYLNNKSNSSGSSAFVEEGTEIFWPCRFRPAGPVNMLATKQHGQETFERL